MEEKKNVPKRRFEGVDNEWKQLKFSDLVNRRSTTMQSIDLPPVEFEDLVSGQGKLNARFYNKEQKIKNGIEFHDGDVLFGKLRPYLKNWLLSDFHGIAVGDFWVLQSKSNNGQFLFYLIQNDKFQQVANLSAGTKMPRSDWNIVSNTSFYVPENDAEQQKIGQFFQRLDNLIELHQQKLQKLKAQKQAYLSEMFPQEGETKPKRRFAGFYKEWELILLEKAAPIRGGYAFNSSMFVKEGIPIIRISNILPSGNVGDEFVYYSELEDDSSLILKNGDILLAMSGATTGKVALINTDASTKMYQNQRVGLFSRTGHIHYPLLHILLQGNMFKHQLKKVLVTGAQPNVSPSDIGSFSFLVPTEILEQQKIGAFFQKLDSLIEKQEERVKKYQALKQAYLNEMFV